MIGEITGSATPAEVVIIGAHLDSWDLGTGALDNGANAAMLIDLARRMRRLGIAPRRTIRLILWDDWAAQRRRETVAARMTA